MKNRFLYLFVYPVLVILGLQNIAAFGNKGYYTLSISRALALKDVPWYLKTDLVKNPVSRLMITSVVMLLLVYLLILFVYDIILKRNYPQKVILIFSVAFVLLEVLVPMSFIVAKRMRAQDRRFLSHDGGIEQTEIAVKLIMDGKNPYGYDYSKTSMAGYFHLEKLNGTGDRLDPDYTALMHYPYFPGSFLISIPFKFVSDRVLGFYDQRLVYILCYIMMLAVVFLLSTAEFKPAVPVLFGLFPMFTTFVITGRNEIFYISFLLLSFYYFFRQKYIISFFVLALSFSIKQFAVLMIPFYLLFMRRKKEKILPGLLVFSLVSILLILPFFLWNSGAFLDDTLFHSSGISKTPYPMGGTPGYGFSNFVMLIGGYQDRYAYFPFQYISVTAYGLIFVAVCFLPAITRKEMMFSFALGLLFFSFFGRMFHDNYMIGSFFLIATSIVLPDADTT